MLSISFNSFADLKTGLIAYYPFNGNANDESGNNHNGIINDATLTKDSLGKANSAYNFNGYNSYISVSDALDLRLSNKIASISLFIKSLSDNQLAAVIRKGISCNIPGWSMDSYTPSTNPFIFLAWNDLRSSWAWNVSNKENITQGEWHHIVMVSDGKVATIYLDGKFINSSSVDSSINIDTNSPMFIGAAPPGACGSVHAFYNGDIDELRIYNRALTSSEVTILYQQGAKTIKNGVSSNTDQCINNANWCVHPTFTVFGVTKESDIPINLINTSYIVDGLNRTVSNGKVNITANLYNRGYADAMLDIYDKQGNWTNFIRLDGNRPETSIVGDIWDKWTTTYDSYNDEYSTFDPRDAGSSKKLNVGFSIPNSDVFVYELHHISLIFFLDNC